MPATAASHRINVYILHQAILSQELGRMPLESPRASGQVPVLTRKQYSMHVPL